MSDLNVIILAAGKGERMVSKQAKVLHPLLGRPLLSYSLDVAFALRPKKVMVVVGHQAQEVKKAFAGGRKIRERKIQWVHQAKPLGTGHAVMTACAHVHLKTEALILYGDVPLLRLETLQQMQKSFVKKQSDLMVATTHLEDPSHYGRIIRNERGEVEGIVEEKELNPQQTRIQEINLGIYWLKADLLDLLKRVKKSAVKKEYYLTDLVSESIQAGKKVNAFVLKDSEEALGVNTREELSHAARLFQTRINQAWMSQGVTLLDPQTTWIEPSVRLASDVVIHPGVVIQGETQVASGAEVLAYSVIEDSIIQSGARIGPFAHLRPGSVIESGAHVGNFVETKKTVLGRGAKANHLAYLGDARIGAETNVGAGTITCNYDGKKKHQTLIGKKVFIGSDTQLVAPVKIGDGALIGAGTTVTKDVPARALVLSRVAQTNVVRRSRK